MLTTKKLLTVCVFGIGIIVGSAVWSHSASRRAPSVQTGAIVDDNQRVLELIARRNQVKGQLIPRHQNR